MSMKNADVAIVGAGPTGLVLAAELALAGADVALVERRVDQDVAGSRAGGLHPRTMEILDQRGIADRFVAKGRKHPVVPFGEIMLDIGDLPTRYAYWLGLWQNEIERLLADWAGELAVPIHRGCEVAGFVQDETGVDVALADGRSLRAKYLVGCDGGRSLVRKTAGIDFPGWEATVSSLIFEGEMTEEPAWGIRHGERGVNALGRLDDARRVRGVVSERQVVQGGAPALDELREALIAAYGTDYGVHDVTWLSRFTNAARQAASYRKGRIFLAGDAAHVHSPAGGQGLNIGVRDAVNLGWKLALVVRGTAPESLLDSYHTERHPVGARLLRNATALSALQRGDDATNALRAMMSEAMQLDEPRQWFVAMMSGLNTRYDPGEATETGHPLLGRRMPDLDLDTADGPQRVYMLLHRARPVLLDLGMPGGLDIAPWADRVDRVEARHEGKWELPAIGAVAAPGAVLIRPDGYVAWVGEGERNGLAEALTRWFGPPLAV